MTGAAPANFGSDKSIRYVQEAQKYVRKDADGVEFEWDSEKAAWFPMVHPRAICKAYT